MRPRKEYNLFFNLYALFDLRYFFLTSTGETHTQGEIKSKFQIRNWANWETKAKQGKIKGQSCTQQTTKIKKQRFLCTHNKEKATRKAFQGVKSDEKQIKGATCNR